MSTAGMNMAEVRHMVDQLRMGAERLRGVVSAVDGRVTHSSWIGQDADQFKHQWWPGHRQLLLNAADGLQGLAQSASNNADEQERASGVGGAGGTGQAFGGQTPGDWLASGAAVLGGALSLGGQFATGLDEQFTWFSHAQGLTEVLDWPFFRGAHSPANDFIQSIAKDGKITHIGTGLTALSVAAGTYQTAQDFRSGDYYGGTLDGIDTAVDPFKTKSPTAYLAVAGTELWTDVFRDAREVDWNPAHTSTYAQYMNPFVAKNWSETIIPGIGSGLREGAGQIMEDLLP